MIFSCCLQEGGYQKGFAKTKSACNACGLEALATHLSFKAAERKIVYDGDLEFDSENGELLGCLVE